ncbi:non-ribosomal peptide synthetase [Brevibacillus sp. 1238]|uniref:non-ribosomal peptide synthetase n=1 Tax=Brevibacillus sp. 1238 TaxID=2940565 RepID=UPI002473C177|nr:non-ribosomal peptide synthetase [Brevibacillus sp. 1238]MDH6351844.1 amino acid adenylation domain-containing protein [Brevibacillus sp. 1238]
MMQKLAGAANRNDQRPSNGEQSMSDWQGTHALNLPLDFVRPAVKGTQKEVVAHKTGLELKSKLELAAEKETVSAEVFLLAAFMLLLAKYTGQEHVVVGWSSDSLQQAGGSETARTAVATGHVHQDRTWREFLLTVEQTCMQVHAAKRFFYEELLATMELPQDPSRNPLFDVRIKKRHTDTAGEKDDFALAFDLEQDGIFLQVEYDVQLFLPSTMERMLSHYVNLLAQLAQDADQRLADVDMLSAAERERLVYGWNETTTAYPAERSIAHMLKQQVEQRPDDIAVVFGEQSLTYAQLHAQSNQIAHALHHKGIGKGDVVVVMAERSLELVTGLFGVLKAGAAYTPVDPGYPAERLRYLLRHSKAKLLLVQRSVQDRITDSEAEVVAVEDLLAAECAWPSEDLPLSYDPEQLMYVLYTSGSTGNPKGAMIRSHSFVNLLHWYTREFALGENDRMLLIASASFDLAQKNLYAPLITGGRLVLFAPGLYDYEQMSATIEREGITAINCTPSAFYPLVEANADDDYQKLRSLRWVFLGGEPIHMNQLAPWLRSAQCQAEIVNTYGPTECTDIASYYRLHGKDWQGETNLPIGKPIDNVRLYVVDKDMRLVPEGLEGELCIGGVGVGFGYYNAPELTQERFVQSRELPEQVVYKTGDVVKRLPDGQIVFIGRVDHQVKVRGFRIEIEEIEKKLLDHPQIKETVVTALQDAGGDTTLRAYVVPAQTLTTEQIYDYLQTELPSYMIPQFVIVLEALPLTPNGKVDRKALPVPSEELAQAEEQAAEAELQDETEQQLLKLWQEVLGIRKAGRKDSFFRLGGHSLKAVALLSRIKKTFGVAIPIHTLFRQPTIQQLAEVIRHSPKTNVASILPAGGQEYYRLSSEQERLYVLEQFEHVGTAYNVPWAAHVSGPFDAARCQQAFAALSLRHETLRTCFELIGDTVLQKVLPKADGFFTYEEASGEQPDQLIRQFVRPLDLRVGPLFRVKVIRLGAEEHLLLLDMHHIIADGISLQIVLQEFAALYNEGKTLEPLPMQYKDYANWQCKHRETLQSQEKYWLDVLQGELPVLNLPLDYPRPPLQSFAGDKITARLDTSLVGKLRQVAEETDTTLYMVLLAAYHVLLHKYTGQTDIIVGSPIAGRPQAEFEHLVGMFVNTLALRNFPHPDKPFRTFLAEVRESCLQAYEHQEWPFEKLVEKLQPTRDLSRNPLFDTMFVLQNMENSLPSLPGVELVALPINSQSSQFDLMLEAVEQAGSLQLNLEFCTKLFAPRTMEKLLRHYVNLLAQLAQDADQRLIDMDMLSAAERERLVYGWNETTTAYPAEQSIAHMLKQQVEQRPDDIAVVFGEQSLTYAQLHAQSNQIAHALHHKGIGKGDVVVVMAERSLELVTGLFGVLKAGAAYTPVDPGYPAERLRYLLRHSKAKLLLVQRSVQDRITDSEAEVVAVEDLLAAECAWPSEDLPLSYDPEQLMYVLYTSGSTGNPKGAMIRSHSFVNLLHWYTREFALGENDRMLLIASASFDLAQKNLYAPLITGGRLVLFEPGLYDYEQMSATIEREGITAINCTPSAFYPLVEANADDDYQKLRSLRWVFLGGEPIHMNQLAPWLRSAHCQAEIVNTYGPTECTDIASYYRLHSKDWQGETNLPIGKPIDNVRLYVVDKDMRLVPEGLEGELCIGGVGVGFGYYNAPELTQERFVQSRELPEQVVYKTGDVVKRLPDGQIVFIGRVDHQVKVRGFRIEIEEIEKKLLDHPQVKEAVVTALQDAGGDTTLRAYVVPAQTLTTEQIYDYLQTELPGYMIPQFVIVLEAMPLTPNGKVDRKALPVPSAELEPTDTVQLQGEIEQQLVKLWQETLGIRKVGHKDSFFRLGGHSLKAVALLSRMKKAFGVSIPISTLFRKPTIQQLAEVIRHSPKTSVDAIPTAGGQQYHRLSSEQERLYVLEQFEHVGTAYNVPWAAHVSGPFDAARCQQAFAALSLRHESLRTCFELIGDTVVQKVLPKADGFFTYEEAGGEQPDQLIRQFVRPFDLSVGPLFRVKAIRLGAEEHLLLLDMHHIIADGISLQIVLQEFAALYEGKTLEPLPMQYKDYANWQCKRRETLQSQEKYWLDLLQGELPVLNLPLDHPRPPLQSFAGDKVTARLDPSLTRKLRQVAEETNTTLYTVLLSVYYVLLHKYTGQTDIIVGSPIAGRPQAEFEHLVGMFVNTLALRSFPHPDKPFRTFLAEVRESCLQAYEHQEWPFEKLVEKLQPTRDLSRNPLFDTMFVLQNMENSLPAIEAIKLVALPIHNQASQFDLMLEAVEQEKGLQLNLEFCTSLFATSTMERLLGHYIHLLTKLAQDADQRLADIELLSDAEGDDRTQPNTAYPVERSLALTLEHEQQLKQRAEKLAVKFDTSYAGMNTLPALEAVEERPDYPASSAQKRLFMIDKLLGRGTSYNVPVIRRVNGKLDSKRLEQAMRDFVQRHESLRTAFQLEVESGALRQKIDSAVSFAFPVYALTEAEAAEMIRDFVRPFRLDKAPLFRAALIELTDREESILIIDMHHIITDGMSVAIMLKELAALYEKRQLETLRLQYKDYAVWENQLMKTQEWQKQEQYWLDVFKEPVHPVRLPFSRPAALTAEVKSRTLHVSLEEKLAAELQNLAYSTDTTLFMVMLAAFTLLLSKLSGQDDIVVGTPISGRHHDGLENIVGMFVNTLAIRNRPRSSQSFLAYVSEVKERLLEAYENQDYAFDHLVDKLNVPREINSNPLFNVMFQFAQQDEAEKIDGLKLLPVEYDGAPSKFDLHVVVVQEDQRTMHLEMTYRETYLPDDTVHEFLSHFHDLVQQIVENANRDREEIATTNP